MENHQHRREISLTLIIGVLIFSLCEINDTTAHHWNIPDHWTHSTVRNVEKSTDKPLIFNRRTPIGSSPIPSTQVDTNSSELSELCKNSRFDAIFTHNNDTFILKGDQYWKHTYNTITPGYPKPISQKWPGLPGNVDAAFSDSIDYYTYFLKGSQYWKFDNERLLTGYPKDIKLDFPGVPDNVQASMKNYRNGELYIFKGDDYWVVQMYRQTVENAKKLPIQSTWRGLPGNLDGAWQSPYDFAVYFFKNERYYKYVDNEFVLDDPPYPKRVPSNWFGCPKVNVTREE